MDEAKELFKKLKIYSLLDLALIIPVSYDDRTLSSSLKIGENHTLEATVESTTIVSGKLRVMFSLVNFPNKISSLFFKTTAYHKNLFTLGSRHYIQGKLESYNSYLQMNQPRSIKSIGSIVPKYKTVLKQNEMQSLIQCYINEQNLFNEGLDSKEVMTILNIHFPKALPLENSLEDLKFIEAYNHLKKLKGKRLDFEPLNRLNGSIKEFTEKLPFALTDEQQQTISSIKEDLQNSKKAAKRMVVGDVGSGKTMVILASAMMALPHKSILMAPTSLLAVQLYEEAMKYLPSYVNIALVMQGNNIGDYKNADFIIGTHAIIYKDDLPMASLVMVDEQHRFGTNQRKALESLVSNGDKRPHFIQFSATPIPRTQAMMDSELLDISLITSTPFKKEIDTKVIGRDEFSPLLTHIKDEISKNHQVLIIYPLVEQSNEIPYQSLEESKEYWESRFDNVYSTHGKDKHKEDVLLEFREKGNVLLATTVVEVGISLPRLTLIVIVGAERLGLSTLHQLRGRVGRNGLKSWCYLFSNNKQNSRLEEFTRTNNGFDIAALDLKFRDSGDILDGTIQSGQKFKWLDLSEDENIVMKAKGRLNTFS